MHVFIITGKTGSGKTTFLLDLIRELRCSSLSIAGFAGLSVRGEGPTAAYEILDLASGKTLPLSSRQPVEGWIRTGHFYFNPQGIRMGSTILEDPSVCHYDLVVVDEIGPFELAGMIWADGLTRLLERQCGSLLLVVREKLLGEVIRKWKIMDPVMIEFDRREACQVAAEILHLVGT